MVSGPPNNNRINAGEANKLYSSVSVPTGSAGRGYLAGGGAGGRVVDAGNDRAAVIERQAAVNAFHLLEHRVHVVAHVRVDDAAVAVVVIAGTARKGIPLAIKLKPAM